MARFQRGEVFVENKDHFTLRQEEFDRTKFKEFIPAWENKKLEPLKFFKHIDKGTLANPEFPNLFPKDKDIKTQRITPKLGTEIEGIQLSSLNDEGKNELALLAAQRGLLIFRNQDFTSHGPQFAVDYGKYYGPLHIHPVSGAPLGFPEIHVVYRNKDVKFNNITFEQRTNLVFWHSDITYELQPPGITFFSVLEGPDAGGDTIFTDSVEAYNRLSPDFQKLLDGLYVEHSSVEQASYYSESGGIQRRDAVKNIHPLVRVHPVTGDKILFVNPQFSRRIVGFKQQESDALLNFLYNHLNNSHDLQARAKWEPNTVVIWDNRRVVHSAIFDWDETEDDVTRFAVRVTPQAERPVADLKDLNKEDVNRLA